jgi:hypothetical protein
MNFEWLSQFCVLGLCSDQDRNIRVGVFPQREEILVGRPALRGFTLDSVGAGKGEVGERPDGKVKHDSTMVQYLMKLCGSLLAFAALARLFRMVEQSQTSQLAMPVLRSSALLLRRRCARNSRGPVFRLLRMDVPDVRSPRPASWLPLVFSSVEQAAESGICGVSA